MTLAPGTRLGSYEVLAPLGRGGMGEVWRARDGKLGREVALKTLPAEFAADPERLARFRREAQLLASLNHPNIGGIHGLEEADGTPSAGPSGESRPVLALVLELVEGETLADRLHAPLPPRDALGLALQICTALEAAHDKGVVHRDLKPANIKITPDGTVKVLDFGLAKAFEGTPGDAAAALTNSPTLSMAATQAGIILGTAAYMSPEQASGGATDRRSDIWSFGVVLFEMLTGKPVFGGETVPHVLAAVLAKDPPWERLPANLHPRLREVLERCLAKNVGDRYRDIGDVRTDLRRVLDDPEGVIVQPAAVAPAAEARSALPMAAAAGVLGLVAATIVAWLLWPAVVPGPVARFSFPLAAEENAIPGFLPTIGISHDGTRIAYAAGGAIYIRDIGDTESRLLPGSDELNVFGAATPAFSPDGESLAFVGVDSPANMRLMLMPVSGGTPITLVEGGGGVAGVWWSDDDMLLFGSVEGIFRMPAAGGEPELVVPAMDGEVLLYPQLLPGGTRVLFTRSDGATPPGFQVAVQSIGADDRAVLRNGAAAARYVETGHLIYLQGSTLFAVPFDPDASGVGGGAVPIVEGVRPTQTGGAQYALSATGTLVSMSGPGIEAGSAASLRTTPVWVGRDGSQEPLPIRADDYTVARVSPDGRKVALTTGDPVQGRAPATWIFDLDTQNLSLLITDSAADSALWGADSRHLFYRQLGDILGMGLIDVETGEAEFLAPPDAEYGFPPVPWAVSPDGRTIVTVQARASDDVDITALDVTNGTYQVLLEGPGNQVAGDLSPDGAWLSYHEVLAPPGVGEVRIVPFPDVSRRRIPVGPGGYSVFSSDGRELFFHDGVGLSVASVEFEPAFRIGTPSRLFDGDYLWTSPGRSWDPHPDGQRFLMIPTPQVVVGNAPEGAPAVTPQIDVVLNWVEELKARVPVN